MIGYLRGTILDKSDFTLLIDAGGVGYEVFCPPQVLNKLGDKGSTAEIFVHTHYKTDGVNLFGFCELQEKTLFLNLIKVDSVGPKSALNILSSAPWNEIAQLIESGDVDSLSKLPKISKKTAEHLVVKLKGKLKGFAAPEPHNRRLRTEATTALAHLGFKPQDVEKTLSDLSEEIWKEDLQSVIRSALHDLSGNN